MTESSLSFESLPKAKRQRKEIAIEFLCKGIKANGDQCSFGSIKGSLYCKRHSPKATHVNVETNTCSKMMIESSTNTEGTMLDITTANKVILELIDDRVKHEKIISELLNLYNILQDQLEELQSI